MNDEHLTARAKFYAVAHAFDDGDAPLDAGQCAVVCMAVALLVAVIAFAAGY